jgi:hypothetical protein
MYLGLGSDYSQPNRPTEDQQWRGTVLQIDPQGNIQPIARELRYPVGLALNARDRLFVTDQQGEQNTFNELNEIIPGRRYGVPTREDQRGELSGFVESSVDKVSPAVQIPHPWTRSVNGLFFLPTDGPFENHPFAGHGIGMEYNGRFLVRFSLQDVEGRAQGAVYPFSRIPKEQDDSSFLGPICGAVAPNGDLYIGSIRDSGWLGGLNVGEVVRLRRTAEPYPNGIREVRWSPAGFEVEFTHPVSEQGAAKLSSDLTVTGYTRTWKGTYATEDSDRHALDITERQFDPTRRTLQLKSTAVKPGYVYELQLPALSDEPLFPNTAAYTVR